MTRTSWLVLELCLSTPLIEHLMSRWIGVGTSSDVTMAGPIGAYPSPVLPRSHCPLLLLNCRSRADT